MGLSQPEMALLLKCSVSQYPKYETRDDFPLYLLQRLIVETDKPYSYWVLGITPSPGKSRGRLKIVR